MNQNETGQNLTNRDFSPAEKSSSDGDVWTSGLSSSWKTHLEKNLHSDVIKKLKLFLQIEMAAGKTIFPKENEYFAALNATPFEKVKVVILGQDPYHGPSQAHGLSFSVRQGVPLPPSLVNIFKELESDLKVPRAKDGDLTAWAKQGVLLLNSVLTVEAAKPGSHQAKGWEFFTDRVIQQLNEQREGLVFVLWGAYAQKKAAFVDRRRHLVLAGPHPSPLSSYRGFFGSKPFSKINTWLEAHGQAAIDWNLTQNFKN